jgi:hypothetical protein
VFIFARKKGSVMKLNLLANAILDYGPKRFTSVLFYGLGCHSGNLALEINFEGLLQNFIFFQF